MVAFEKSEGWKLCHELTLATWSATAEPLARGPSDVLERLGYTALRACGRIAYGSGSRSRRLLSIAIFQAMGWLTEYRELLELAQDRRWLDRATCDRLESLRGRATFYTSKLLPRPSIEQ